MSHWEIQRYNPAMADLWDEFVDAARNSTFLFRRGYMDYHADRFADCSLVALHRGKPAAMLPANITADGVLHSHGGLTYGGWILPRRHIDCPAVMELTAEWIEWCRGAGVTAIDYKPLPSIYAEAPSDEALYALWRHGAVTAGRNISAAIDLRANPGPDSIQRSKLRRTAAAGAETVELTSEADIRAFHSLLSACLAERHDAAPVHSADELVMLHSRFPESIRFYATMLAGVMEAGICVYDTATVRHCQYTATTAEGRRRHLLTPLYASLAAGAAPGQRYVDFGTSNEDGGRILNEGLYSYKASFGASGVVYDRLNLKIT